MKLSQVGALNCMYAFLLYGFPNPDPLTGLNVDPIRIRIETLLASTLVFCGSEILADKNLPGCML
jgi:hypothetical protein